MTSHEVSLAYGDMRRMAELEAQIASVQAERDQWKDTAGQAIVTLSQARDLAQADNAELLRLARSAVECVRGLLYDDGTDKAIKRADRAMYVFDRDLAADHPGASLEAERADWRRANSDLAVELDRARAANHIMYQALGEIDKHRVGACADASWDGTELEPCEECGEMRDIASEALARVRKAGAK